MRHSDPKLTANVYTDPKLLDVAGGLDTLPERQVGDSTIVERERGRATGTHGPDVQRPVASDVALTPVESSPTLSIAGHPGADHHPDGEPSKPIGGNVFRDQTA
jgi:hypothetical protein